MDPDTTTSPAGLFLLPCSMCSAATLLMARLVAAVTCTARSAHAAQDNGCKQHEHHDCVTNLQVPDQGCGPAAACCAHAGAGGGAAAAAAGRRRHPAPGPADGERVWRRRWAVAPHRHALGVHRCTRRQAVAVAQPPSCDGAHPADGLTGQFIVLLSCRAMGVMQAPSCRCRLRGRRSCSFGGGNSVARSSCRDAPCWSFPARRASPGVRFRLPTCMNPAHASRMRVA